MDKTLVFGHKNPDTDAICSAIAYAELKAALGANTEAVRLGNVSGETQYALDTFGFAAPRLVESVAGETKTVILVDHNERQQSVSDIQEVQVLEVIDHHRIANFETSSPLYYRAEPVGCTATIVLKLYKENQLLPRKETAGLLLSAIISDSLLFKSPTCTETDKAAALELAAIAGVDIDTYGLEMLKAGADLSGKTAEELLTLDAKEFQMGGKKVEIAQVNAIDPEDILVRQTELEAAMAKKIADNGLDLFLFAVTDILNSNSTALVLGEYAHVAEQAYETKLMNGRAFLAGVVSRKAQIVPVLTDTFNKQ